MMKVLFMGTPDFARVILEGIVGAAYPVVGVVTQPDKPKGRGNVLTPPPVKVYAEEHGIAVLQPQTLRTEEFENELKKLDPDVIVVAAYGKILPKNVLDYPKYGCINVHGSLLPRYRGAAPIQRALIEGEKTTGITTMYMEEGLDTGDMIEMYEIAIREDDNFETLHDKLADLGAYAIVSTLGALEKGNIKRHKQDDANSTYAKKIEKEDCLIHFDSPAKRVNDLIRGTSPFPLSYAFLGGRMIKIVKARIDASPCKGKPGEVTSIEGGLIRVACGEGGIAIETLVPEGKGRMSAKDFINGRKINVGDVFTSEKA